MNTNAINLWQIQVEAGRPDLNMQKVREQAENTQEWWILILPEMVIPGYMIWDDWLYESYIKHCKDFNDEIIDLSLKYKITIVWWNIAFDETKKNEDWSIRKYNAAYLASNWELLKTQYKTLLPNYRMFDDKRYFTSLKDLVVEENLDNKNESIREKLEEQFNPVEVLIDWVKTKVAMLICEDIWNINDEYAIDPVEMVKKYNPDLITVISASPFGIDKAKYRNKLLEIQSLGTTIAYVNPIWIQNNGKNVFNFDWWSSIYTNWEFVRWVKDYTENTPDLESIIEELSHLEEPEQIFNALVYVIREFWKQNWWEKAMIWLSWGLDSWLVATLLTIALWKENITAINMPSRFNWETTKSLAKEISDNLWIKYIVDSIQESVNLKVKRTERNRWKKTFFESPINVIKELIENKWKRKKLVSDFELENMQARERWETLSSNVAEFWPYTSNGNKDEVMTWYATLYGDINWVLAIIWDLNKETVRELSRWINENIAQLIPSEMIEMQPAAELSDEQNVDNGWWDPFDYKILRPISRAYMEKKKSIEDLLTMIENDTFEEFLWLEEWYLEKVFDTKDKQREEAKRIWRLKTISYFKRVQAPPIPTITRSSFGFDRREAQNKPYFWEEKKVA